jgi:hypothetical protein
MKIKDIEARVVMSRKIAAILKETAIVAIRSVVFWKIYFISRSKNSVKAFKQG